MRLPGTTNHKDDDEPVPVVIESMDLSRRFTPQWLAKYLPKAVARPLSGGTKHHPGAVTDEQQALCDHVVTRYGGHNVDVSRNGSMHLVRPGKKDGTSASIIIGNEGDAILTVFTPHWPEIGTRSGEQFRSWVLGVDGELCHPGDKLAQVYASPSPTKAKAGASLHLPEDFWDAREVLGTIRQSAHARQRSGDAVLHAVLARVAAAVSHTIKIPPIVASEAPLCFFTVLLAPPGVGKSSAQRIADELLPARDEFGLGSGEGIVEALFDWVKEPDEKGKMVNVKRQVRYNALISIDEGDALSALGGRSGSTLLSTLRTLWTGGLLGQTNASQDRRRIVPAGQYTYGVVMGLQLPKAGPLLADTDAGTPQRFCWVMATDPAIPETRPPWPRFVWSSPSLALLERHRDSDHFARHYMDVAPSIESEIREIDIEQARAACHFLTLTRRTPNCSP